MIDSGLFVDMTLPFSQRPGSLTPSLRHGSLLLLKVVNLLDSHDPELERGQERIEMRLDLMLHWLSLQLFGQTGNPLPTPLKLGMDTLAWATPEAPLSEPLIIDLHVHPALAAPVRLEGHVVSHSDGHATASLKFDTEEMSEAWTQWLFRCHRRVIHETRKRAEPG